MFSCDSFWLMVARFCNLYFQLSYVATNLEAYANNNSIEDLFYIYRIRPNYRTVRLGFSKLQGIFGCGKIRIYLLRIHYLKKSEKALFDDNYAFFFLILFIKAYVVGTHLNCIDKSMQFK